MADFSFTDTPVHNARYEFQMADGDTYHINAGDYNDTAVLSGRGDANVLAGAGNDVVDGSHMQGTLTAFGGEGADVLKGGCGDDHLHGGYGQDVLIGGAGNDVLQGGPGRDFLTGGSGDDLFLFEQGPYNYAKGWGVDVVKDASCGDTFGFQGSWGASLHWDSEKSGMVNQAGYEVTHFTGHEGDTFVDTGVVQGGYHLWELA